MSREPSVASESPRRTNHVDEPRPYPEATHHEVSMYTPIRGGLHARTRSTDSKMLSESNDTAPSNQKRPGQSPGHSSISFTSAADLHHYDYSPTAHSSSPLLGGMTPDRTPPIPFTSRFESLPSDMSPPRTFSTSSSYPKLHRKCSSVMQLFSKRLVRSRTQVFALILLLVIITALYVTPLPDDAATEFDAALDGSDPISAPGGVLPAQWHQSIGALKQSVKSGVYWTKDAVTSKISGWISPQDRAKEEEPIYIDVLPKIRTIEETEKDEKFIGYLPHSQYHNQRQALVTALQLGKRLNRTVLIPPVWLGSPAPWSRYQRLQRDWDNNYLMTPQSFQLRRTTDSGDNHQDSEYVNKISLHTPSAVGPTLTLADACAPGNSGCRPITSTSNTFLGWDALVNIERMVNQSGISIASRWDMREDTLRSQLLIAEEEVYKLLDTSRYQYQFEDDLESKETVPLVRPNLNRITPDDSDRVSPQIVSLKAMSGLDHRVILLGSIFGTGRLNPPDWDEVGLLNRALAFRSPWIMKAARAMRHRLGGPEGFVGVHARVGDGVFQDRAMQHMEETWHALVSALEVDPSIIEIMWELVRPTETDTDAGTNEVDGITEPDLRTGLTKRRVLGRQHRAIATISDRPIDARDDHRGPERRQLRGDPVLSPSLRFLNCRGTLNTNFDYLPFNTPVYLATDSVNPLDDPRLSVFFKAFPCTFVLSDFIEPCAINGGEIVKSAIRMKNLANKNDGVDLGRLYVPFLEATIASMGFRTIGTAGSTFSNYIEHDLHDAYRTDLEEEDLDTTPRDDDGVVFTHW